MTEVKIGWGPEVFAASMDYLAHIFGADIGDLLEDPGDRMTTYVRPLAELGCKPTATDDVLALDVIANAYAPVGAKMARHDILIWPTPAIPAPEAEFDSTKDEIRVNDTVVDPFLGWAMTVPFNMLSRLPVLAVPSGHADNGVPTGIQIVGRSYCDADVFRAGAGHEAALGGWYNTPKTRPTLG